MSLLVALLWIGPAAPALAGGVAVLGVELSDNGDDDGYADTQETVTLRLVVENTSGQPLTGVVARLHSNDGALACLTTAEIAIGALAAGERRTTAQGFVFVVPGNVERVTVADELFATFDVEITSNEIPELSMRQEIVLDLDLDVSGGAGPSSFLESFEVPSGFGAFSVTNLDQGLHDPNADCCFGGAAAGYRCQYSAECPGATCPHSQPCAPGIDDAHADAVWWKVDGPGSPGGGRAFSGTRSLYMGEYGASVPYTTPSGILEAIRTEQPIHLGWERVCEITRGTACADSDDCPAGESCVDVMPVLSFKQQVSLLDSRESNAPPGEAADRGVVQVQLADDVGNPVGNWMRIEPYYNIYDQQATDEFSDCMFDPVDDGTDEWDLFDPGFSNLGPSSSCFPEFAFVYLGDTDEPFDAGNLGNASDGPGLQGSSGPGTWVESRFSLARFRGRSIRIRFLHSSLRSYGVRFWEDWGDLGAADDGWWIDDVSIGDTLTDATTVAPDTKDNSALPVGLGDGEGDGVFDDCDNCADDANADQSDLDVDYVGDVCDVCPRENPDDRDSDGVCDPPDNCPTTPNSGQEDRDNDTVGDACDNCPDTFNPTQEVHFDFPELIPCPEDNCPFDYNPGQEDDDGDGLGNVCDPCPTDPLNDDDEDGVCYGDDNCPDRSNPEQGVSVVLSRSLGDPAQSFVIAPDDDLVLFVQQLGIDPGRGLHRVRISDGIVRELTDPNAPDGSVKAGIGLTGDGGTALYILNPFQSGDPERLYAVPVEGGPSTLLNAPLVGSETVYEDFATSPDGSRVIFRASESSTEQRIELFSAPLTGGTATRLSAPLVGGGDVTSMAVSPDGTRVVYRADQDSDDVFELYSVPVDGGAPIRLNPTLPAGGDVTGDDYQISADSARVVYLADQDLDEVFELYSVPIDGGTSTKLNAPLAAGRSVLTSTGGFRISPDGARVVYVADQSADEVWELFSVPTAGGTPVRLSASLGPDGDVQFDNGQAFEIASDSARVVYLADQDTDETDELYSVPIAGGSTTKLNGPLPAGAGAENGYRISNDATTVVYRANQEVAFRWELFAVAIAGGPTTKLNPVLWSPSDSVHPGFQISDDSSRVLFKARVQGSIKTGLHNVPLSGGPSVELTDGIFVSANESFGMDSDGSTTVWTYYDLYDLRASDWDFDGDGDGIPVYCDNCPGTSNAGQADGDADGAGTACDCDDANAAVFPGAPQVCDGRNNDCDDPAWPALTGDEADGDGDGFSPCQNDCNDADPDTYPDAPEINDGLDNQCPGDGGSGLVDETSGNSGFHNPADRNEYSWTAQQGATQYEVARSTQRDFASGCLTFTTSSTLWVDTETPPGGAVFHYLNRPLAPNAGSWGEDSGGTERTNVCP